MVVEHTFVTTMDAREAMIAASQFLQEAGFVAEAQSAFPLDGGWPALELRRGRANTATARGLADWPQQIRIEWDRGRVDVAASITPPARTRSWNVSLSGTSEVKPRKVDTAQMQELLTTAATAIEILLVARQPGEARARWNAVESRFRAQADKRRRRSRITLIVVAVFVALAVGLAVFAAVASR